MHASTMTTDQLEELERQVFTFFETRKHLDVSIAEAAGHFEALGHTLTRPIVYTLQTYGVAMRPLDADVRRRWPFPELEDAWRLDGRWLRPRSPKPEARLLDQEGL